METRPMLLPVVPAVVLALAVSTAGFSEETPVEERVGRTSFRRPTVALVLEGGGALGLAHVGVIKVLEEVGIPVDIVTGTSMGSIVGGLYALGYDAASLERVAAETDWLKLFSEYDTAWNESYRVREDRGAFFLSVGVDGRGITGLGGLLSGNRVLTYLDCLVAAAPGPVPSRDFDDLPRRYRAVATDAETGDEVVLSGGSPADAMRASMGIPGVFAPYPLGGRLLVDGGLVNNLPVDLARSLGADIIIAVDLPGGFFTQGKSVEQNALDSLSRTVEIMIRSHVLPQLEKADFLITVDLREFTAADFAKGPAIRAQGEAAARRALPRLQALRDSLFAGGRPETSGAEQPAAEGPAIDTVVIVGGTQADRNAARKLLTSLEGTSPDFCVLADRVSRVYAERPIQGLRIRRNADRPGELTAELQSRKSEGHVLRLGLSYGGTYSKSSSSRVTVTPGVALRNVFGDESELAVNVEALGALGMEAAVRKEFRGFLFSEASFSARRDFDTYYFSGGEESSVEFVLYESSAKLGFRVGAYPLPGTRLSLGFDRDWISDTASPIYLPDLSGSDVSVLSAAFSVMKTDSPVLPMEGISLDILLRQGIPILGASRFFRTLDGAGEAHLSLDTPFSLGILWRAGMDFSGAVDASDSAPLLYKPDLADRRLFPNPLSAEERIGNLVAAGGVEVKSRLDRLSQAVRVPAVVLFHGAVGVSYQDFYLSDQTDPALHWNAAAGAGLRINDGFALLLRGGAAGGYGREIFPYFAVDLGAIGRTR